MDHHELENACNGYLSYCRYERALSENTIDAYAQDLVCFRRFNSDEYHQLLLTEHGILSYLRFLRDAKNLKPTSLKRRMLTVRSLSEWMLRNNYIAASPFAEIKLDIKLPKRLPRPVDRSVISSFLSHPDRRTLPHSTPVIVDTRDTSTTSNLAVRIMVSTGIRVGELTNIKINDVLDRGKQIRVFGKGRRERYVYITNADLVEDIVLYHAARLAGASGRSFLLVNRNGDRLTEQAVRRRLKNLSAKFGIEPAITPHQFRHSAATFLVEEGVDIRVVQRLLSHASIATTEIYTQVSDTSLIHALNKADTLGKVTKNVT